MFLGVAYLRHSPVSVRIAQRSLPNSKFRLKMEGSRNSNQTMREVSLLRLLVDPSISFRYCLTIPASLQCKNDDDRPAIRWKRLRKGKAPMEEVNLIVLHVSVSICFNICLTIVV